MAVVSAKFMLKFYLWVMVLVLLNGFSVLGVIFVEEEDLSFEGMGVFLGDLSFVISGLRWLGVLRDLVNLVLVVYDVQIGVIVHSCHKGSLYVGITRSFI